MISGPESTTYTDKERALLSFYFSEVDGQPHGDIYLVRNLPEEVRATLNGLYSRSHLAMRDALLTRLKQGLQEQGMTLDQLAIPEQRPDQAASFLQEKSGKFLKTYAIDHGHNSLREGSVLHFAVENVSQLVTRFMQRERRCSFEESSTRYISFSNEGHWRDPDIAAAGGAPAQLQERTITECFGLYGEATQALIAHLERVRPRGAEEKPEAYRRALRSEALDAARYLLLPGLFTKFGMVLDARTLADMISELRSHPLAEFRLVGERLRAQGDRVARTLLTHADARPFLVDGWTQRRSLARTALGDATAERSQQLVTLVAWDADLDARLLTSLLWEHGETTLAQARARVAALDAAERARLFDAMLGTRAGHDPLPLACEGAQPFEFECLVDFGAYRDIGRHRKGWQQMQPLTTHHGFAVPPLIAEAGLEPRYRAVLERAADAWERVRQPFPFAADYLVPFAFLQRVRIVFDPRQTAYFIELRSAPEGHFSYRAVAQAMHDEVARVAPLFARAIRVHRGAAFLGRLESEQSADERRARRMKQAGD